MSVTAPATEPGPPVPMFLDGGAGPLFAIYHAPAAIAPPPGRPAVLYLPPFAEEMNRARRMAALLGRRLAHAGVACLILDPFGTGDSGGDFADAGWDLWRQDAGLALRWLSAQGHGEISILGLRLGACLALDVARMTEPGLAQAILWNPVLRGEMYLNQFLRIRTAAGLTGAAAGGETSKDLRARLRAGETLEIAGYPLTPALAEALGAQDLVALGQVCPVPVRWLELGGEGAALPPAAAKAVESLEQKGIDLTVTCLRGEPFWSIEETVVAPALLDATVAMWSP